MKNRKKSPVRMIFWNLALLAAVILLSYLVDVYVYRGKAEPPVQYYVTNRGALEKNLDKELQILSRNEDLKRLALDGREEEKEYGTYVIPGLKSTRTLATADAGIMQCCTSMTPQGIAATEDYLLISAYCKTGKHNSVIYVLDKKSHRFLKHLVLPGQPHAGGVAYDAEHGRIWYSSHDQGIAQAVSFSLSDLEDYQFLRDKLPIPVQTTYLYGVIRDSFLTFEDGYLYVGYFSGTSEGTLVKYQIDEEGKLVTANGIPLAANLDMAIPVDTGRIPSCVQGIAFYGDYMLVSQSYGILPSALLVYKKTDKIWYEENRELISYQMPEHMEQICVDGDQLYTLFESCAYAYRASSFNIIDRAVKINMKKIMEDLE